MATAFPHAAFARAFSAEKAAFLHQFGYCVCDNVFGRWSGAARDEVMSARTLMKPNHTHLLMQENTEIIQKRNILELDFTVYPEIMGQFTTLGSSNDKNCFKCKKTVDLFICVS
jgi:hypothetical protein